MDIPIDFAETGRPVRMKKLHRNMKLFYCRNVMAEIAPIRMESGRDALSGLDADRSVCIRKKRIANSSPFFIATWL